MTHNIRARRVRNPWVRRYQRLTVPRAADGTAIDTLVGVLV